MSFHPLKTHEAGVERDGRTRRYSCENYATDALIQPSEEIAIDAAGRDIGVTLLEVGRLKPGFDGIKRVD